MLSVTVHNSDTQIQYTSDDAVLAVAITLIIARVAFGILKETGMLLADTAMLQIRPLRGEAHFGEAQEDKAEDGLRVLGGSKA